jgi:hypothetical protein
MKPEPPRGGSPWVLSLCLFHREKKVDSNPDRLKRLDLLGGFDAGVLGAGLALVFAQWLEPFPIPALLIGILPHGWAMFAESKLEHQTMMGSPSGLSLPNWSAGRCLLP